MVAHGGNANVTRVTGGRRVLVGANVTLMVVLALGITVVCQLLAYSYPVRRDMTSTGVNSLTPSTEKLLRELDKNIRLTSLCFETDREEADQPRYREAVRNVLALYESTHRSKISADWINPLKDHQKLQDLSSRLRQKAAFKEGIETYKARVDAFKNELDARLQTLLQSEVDAASSAAAGIERSATPTAVAQVEELLRRLTAELQITREQAEALTNPTNPQLAAAINDLRTLYPKISRSLKEISKFASAELTRNPNLPAAQAAFLRDAGNRYAEVVAAVEGETTKLGELKPLEIDDLLSRLQPTANAIVLETDDDAAVVDFSSIWPPIDPNAGARAPFTKRAFKGEEQLTAAILRATHKEQTAIVFVRYGGQPLFMGGFMPNQPPAPYTMMKQQLEDVNFVVTDWDLKTKDTPPEIEPPPTRTIFVVLKPESPQRNPMDRSPQEPPFGESHRQALLKALGDNGRALFIAGWTPGPFGPMPSTYEYGDYLKNTWGITVDTQYLLIETVNTEPGKYQVAKQRFYDMDVLEAANNEVIQASEAQLMRLPACAPLELTDPPPAGVELLPLLLQPQRDGVWGIKSIQVYKEQNDTRGFLSLAEGDKEGPFKLAVAAKKGDSKIVTVSAHGFAEDVIAFDRRLEVVGQGLGVRMVNPGNVTLMVNSLHWLNDNSQLLNIGKPIDAAVLSVKNPSTVKTVQALTIFVWPAMALACGSVAWWIRRR
jgi:hypothetical protein